ncbi:MAG: 3-phosphoshikimate 1-carboxyvinyltransferase [Bacteroidota bacterium]
MADSIDNPATSTGPGTGSIKIFNIPKKLSGSISLPSSKSISNRLLIIRAFSEQDFLIENLSDADDTRILMSLLQKINHHLSSGLHEQSLTLDCGNAGTAYRFLLPYLANLPGAWILKGSDRMKERPVKPLVDALFQLDASIEYLDKEGFPPIKIQGKTLEGGTVSLDSAASSQFTSALLMLGAFLSEGLTINITGKTVSQPYVKMTARLLAEFGIRSRVQRDKIQVEPSSFIPKTLSVEPDWSAASYWFEWVCLAEESEILLKGLHFTGLQGDESVAGLFFRLGVICEDSSEGLLLRKGSWHKEPFTFDFTHNPDLAMTMAGTLAGLEIPGSLNGLKNLIIKESNRLEALWQELSKMGCEVRITDDSLSITASRLQKPSEACFTYADHRMALSLAPLAAVLGEISLCDPDVVSKSYPAYWDDLRSLGIMTEF